MWATVNTGAIFWPKHCIFCCGELANFCHVSCRKTLYFPGSTRLLTVAKSDLMAGCGPNPTHGATHGLSVQIYFRGRTTAASYDFMPVNRLIIMQLQRLTIYRKGATLPVVRKST